MRKLLVLFILIQLTSLNLIHAAPASCRSDVFTNEQTSVKLNQLFSDSGFQGTDFNNLFRQETTDAVVNSQNYAKTLKKLLQKASENELADLKKSIAIAEPIFSKYYNSSVLTQLLILQIAVLKEAGIKQWVHKLNQSDTLKTDITLISSFIKEFDPTLVKSLNQEIGLKYNAANKRYTSTSPQFWDLFLPPRRAMTYALKLANDWPQQIIQKISRSKKKDKTALILKTYEEFIEEAGLALQSAGSGYGVFKTDFILDVVQVVQLELAEIAHEQVIDNLENFKVTLDGSFFNGLAKKGSSDIDFFYTHPQLNEMIKRRSFKTKIEKVFKDHGFRLWDLELQDVASLLPEHVRSRKDFAEKMAEMGTLSFKVSLTEIKLLVFPAQNKNGVPNLSEFILK